MTGDRIMPEFSVTIPGYVNFEFVVTVKARSKQEALNKAMDRIGDMRPEQLVELTFRTLFRTFEAILEEPPERGAGATYRLLPAIQLIAATSVSP